MTVNETKEQLEAVMLRWPSVLSETFNLKSVLYVGPSVSSTLGLLANLGIQAIGYQRNEVDGKDTLVRADGTLLTGSFDKTWDGVIFQDSALEVLQDVSIEVFDERFG